MKLLKGRKTSNNKGMSLVELLCSVAILGIAITAISGAMIVSAQNYQKSNVEFDIQKEAQNATNLIGNLVVDAEEVKWEDYDADGVDDLVIYKGDVIYVVRFEQIAGAIGRLVYEEINKVDFSLIARGVLAEDVTGFNVDTAAFATNKNVKVDLKVKKDDKEYDASYNTTARNAEKTNATLGKYAKIEIEDEVILEPGQTYTFDVSVEGTALGLTYNMDSMPVETGWSGDSSHLTFKVLDSASGTYAFAVATNETDPNTGLALATETVTVHIRRVDSITWQNPIVNGASTSTISTFDAGTTYVLYADVACAGGNQYLDKGLNKAYDTHDDVNNDAYVNPRCIGFAYTTEGMSATGVTVEKSEDVNNPYVKITLNEEMPEGAKITITATAKHPNGKNKSSDSYTPSVVETYVITRPTETPYEYALVLKEGSILRGQEYVSYDGCLITNPAIATPEAIVAIINKYSDYTGYYADDQWYFRYKEAGADDSTYSQFYKMSESGLFPHFTAAETQLFEPEKAYDINFVLAFLDEDDKKLMWPTDTNLLDMFNAYLSESDKLSQGWSGTSKNGEVTYDLYDADSIGMGKYGGLYRMNSVSAVYYDLDGYEYGTSVDLVPVTGIDNAVSGVGSEADPFIVTTSNRTEVFFDTTHLYRSNYQFDLILEKYSESSGWTDVTSSINSYMPMTGQKQNFMFMIESFAQTGRYRLHIALTNTDSSNTQAYYRKVTGGSVLSAITMDGEKTLLDDQIDFVGYDESGNEIGYIYLQVNP